MEQMNDVNWNYKEFYEVNNVFYVVDDDKHYYKIKETATNGMSKDDNVDPRLNEPLENDREPTLLKFDKVIDIILEEHVSELPNSEHFSLTRQFNTEPVYKFGDNRNYITVKAWTGEIGFNE